MSSTSPHQISQSAPSAATNSTPDETRPPSTALATVEIDAIIDSTVAQLIVRQLDEALVLALKQRAARAGRSADEEHRKILREVLGATPAKPSFKDFLRSMPTAGEDEDFVVPRDLPRKPAL